MHSHYTNHRRAIVRRYLAGETLRLLGAEFGVSDETLRVFLSKLGVPRRSPNRFQQKHDHKAILDSWHKLKRQNLVSQALGVSRTQVCRVLHAAGIRVGKGRYFGNRIEVSPTAIRKLYRSGLNCREIGRQLGCESEVIRCRLKEMNEPRRPRGKYERRGNLNPQWRGGRRRQRNADTNMHYYRRQSYEVAAICLGQPLQRGFVIHHADENWGNNNPDNLLIFPSQRDHVRFHQQLLKSQRSGKPFLATLLVLENGGWPLPPPPHPLQLELDKDHLALLEKKRKRRAARKASKQPGLFS